MSAVVDPCFEVRRQRAALKVGTGVAGAGGAGLPGGGVPGVAGSTGMPPWEVPPPGFRPFDFAGAIPTPAGGTSATVLSFTVPFGWDGVIKRVTNRFIGPGFNEASGDLIWSIRLDSQFAPNYGSIIVTMGDLQNGREIAGGILISSQQLVEYVIAVSLAFVPGPGTSVFCAFTGYFWPRQ